MKKPKIKKPAIPEQVKFDSVMITGILALLIIAIAFIACTSTLHVEANVRGVGSLEVEHPVNLTLKELSIDFEADVPLIMLYNFQTPFTRISDIIYGD